MIEKMTLDQFRKIKKQLASIIKQVADLYKQHKNDENYNHDADEKRLTEEYLAIQNRLLSYDLSDIPYAEWMNMKIIADENHIADFSKTNANIDFYMLDYSPYTNYKSCKIENIRGRNRILNSEHFDSDVIKNNPSLFLSDSFPSSVKQKFYNMQLNMEDLFSLSINQIQELQSKQFINCFDYSTRDLINKIGFQKAMQLYVNSKDDYKVVHEISFLLSSSVDYIISDPFTQNDFEEELKNADVTQIKNVCYSYMRKALFKNHKRYNNIILERLPEQFVKENNDILLIGENIPDDLRQRYYTGRLTLDDIMNNISLFRNIPISQVTDEIDIGELADALGEENLPRYIEAYPEIFNYIIKSHLTYQFCNFASASEKLNLNQTDDVKQKITNYLAIFLTAHNKLGTGRTEQLMAYDTSLFPLDKMQQRVIDTLNLDNIKRFEKETQFFSINNNTDLQMFQAFASYFRMHSPSELAKDGIDFKNGTLQYEEFLDQLAKCLDHMKQHNVFADFPDYDFVEGEFRDKHPEIFVDINAPEELKDAFYRNKITPEFLFQHKEYIPYLTDKNLLNTLRANIKLSVPSLVDEQGRIMPMDINFVSEYISRYGNEKLLQLVSKYGVALSDIIISSLYNEIENEQTIEKSLRNSIYNKIIKGKMNYSYLASVSDFVSDYPKLFVNFENLTNISREEKQRLTKAFYSRTLSFDDVKKYPELADYLKDKNLLVAFGKKDGNHYQGRIFLDTGYGRTSEKKYSDLELLEIFGNEKFLQLCAKYGRYMDGIAQHLNKDITIRNGKYLDLSMQHQDGLSFEEVSKLIEDVIVRESKLGNLAYRPDDAPSFLKEREPKLFLSEDAPEELKQYFYNYSNNYPMSFEVLQKHKDWLPFLKDKALTTSLLRNNYLKKELIQYLEVFGEEKGIKLGINRAETVKEMMRSHQIELMKSWYDKTGGKFIPDFVVMQNFRLEEADKFLSSGSNWSNLMKIKNFAQTPESRDAMLKLAYSFGAFDQDQRGFKKLQDLLTGLPKKIDSEQAYIFEQIDQQINLHSQRGVFFGVKSRSYTDSEGNVHTTRESFPSSKVEESYQKMMEHIKNNPFIDLLDTQSLLNLMESLKQENVGIDFSRNIFTQIYRKNEDGSYTLTINAQSCPKSAQAIRNVLEKFREVPILTPDKAHQLFGGFELKYDADFREFLLANMDKIMASPEYVSLVASVQRQFSDIKAINSNRALTWELAVSYVQTNKFTSVNVGNERVAEISAIAGYSQADFNTLQQIYNYGKQRTFSSIPRIEQSAEKTSGKYTYETLRLDDPLAMAIGTLTDCCQELNNCAEVCMEHSMVDKNGRVFVIKDEQGNIVAQSWVWRNKDVLCFDNIEIPDKAFARAVKEHPELGRKGFTDEVFEIYKQAAHDLIESDEKVYRELLESGKITQEQYDGLRLGKITVGLGYNDIAESLKQNSAVDKGTISRPLPFEEPVKLSRGLYTSDSTTQYILEERDDRKEFDGDTLPVHSDAFVEYSDSNFTEKSLLSLEKLEIVTKEDPRNLDTSVSDYADSEHLVTEIAINYGLNPETARIIMNPNFAIIYDVNGDKLRVGDLLFNTKVDNEQQQMDIENQVVMQMRLALEQIASDKEIDVSSLDEKQKEMYAKITGLTDEMDKERGVGHAR
ncbi:MAG: hypothetical protein E7158_01325 [Firmicutes bacterium]|nr:hypothetical protein [Bacillota bacterium]